MSKHEPMRFVDLASQADAAEGVIGDGSRQGARPSQTATPEPVSETGPYPRYEPGRYDAECVSAQIYFDRQFRSWKCALRFSILEDEAPIFCFLHLGSKAKPTAGPRSEYRRAWIIANGGQPRKRQSLSPRIFTGKIFEVIVGDVAKRFDGREHPAQAIYSIVRQIVSRTFP